MDSLLITPELFASEGGISRILRLYLQALCEMSRNDEKVRLVTLNDDDAPAGGIEFHTKGRLFSNVGCNRSKAKFIARAFQAGLLSDQIICGHVAQLPVAWAISKFRPSLRYYAVAHGIEVWSPLSFLQRRALAGATRVLCVSEFTRRQLLAVCPMPEHKTAVLPNALDPCLEPGSVSPIPDGPPTILTISRLSLADSYKGVDHLIEAMQAVVAVLPQAKLRIVGRGDGLPQLEALAHRLNVNESVEFAGYVSDSELHGEFERCSLFALPSQKEGFGLVYVEAMAHGRPCLGANAGGTPEVISPDTGALVEYANVHEIALSIVSSLARTWSVDALRAHASSFSFSLFKQRLAGLLAP